MAKMSQKELREYRKQMFSEMEDRLKNTYPKEEDRLFYYHSSEDRIVLSHAIFWVMTKSLVGRITKERFFLLLRQYQEEMLDAFLQEDEYFHDLLRYCNIMYESLPIILNGLHDYSIEKDARKLAAIAVVAGGYAGDMPEDLCNVLLDDMDYVYNKVKCRAIERMVPQLNKMVVEEMKSKS
jgi:hypothetical protein